MMARAGSQSFELTETEMVMAGIGYRSPGSWHGNASSGKAGLLRVGWDGY